MNIELKKYLGETTEYDKKAELEEKKPKSWLKSVSAFANSLGGTLIFGISDTDEIIGIKDVRHGRRFFLAEDSGVYR